MKKFWQILVVITLFFSSFIGFLFKPDIFKALANSSIANRSNSSGQKLPNIVYIMLDDVGYGDINAYYKIFGKNSDISSLTQNIDKLADEGAVFTDMYACPMCTSSRAQFLTGCYPSLPQINLKLHESERGYTFGLPDTKNGVEGVKYTLPEYLQDLGYKTACFGKWHLGDTEENYPQRHGFEWYIGTMYPNDGKILNLYWKNHEKLIKDERNYADSQHDVTDRITAEFDKYVKNNKDKNFFAYVSLLNLHADIKKLLIKNNERIYPNGKPDNYSPSNLYYDLVKDMDNTVGELIKSLKNNGIYNDTIIVLTSDNGPQWHLYDEKGNVTRYQHQRTLGLRDGKDSLYEGGVRVPFIVTSPSLIKHKIVNERVSTIDMFPTLLTVVNYYANNQNIDKMLGENIVNGVDISALFVDRINLGNSDEKQLSRYLMNERPLFLFYENKEMPSAVIKGSYKYLFNRFTGVPELYRSTTVGENKEINGFNAFPDENKNLIDDPAFLEIKTILKSELENFTKNGYDKLRDKVDECKSEDLQKIRRQVQKQLEEKAKQVK